MHSQARLAKQFRALHYADRPLVLANVWDPLSAAIVVDAGFPAVATASAAVALSRGFDDGEEIPFDELAELVERICGLVTVPVSVDFERGYGDSPDQIRENARRLIAAGAVGVNLEDSLDDHSLRPVDEQCALIAAIRAAGEESDVPVFVNARTDAFMLGGDVEDGVDRLRAYVEAGADGVYPIMCNDLNTLQRVQSATNRPINVLLTEAVPPIASLIEVGVRRLSMGPGLLSIAAGSTADAVRRLAEGDLALHDVPRMSTREMRVIQDIEA